MPKRKPAAAPQVLKRPASRRKAATPVADPESVFRSGKAVVASELVPGVLTAGDWISSQDAVYYGQTIHVAAKVISEVIEGGEREIIAELSGTNSDALLNFASSLAPASVRLHICSQGCGQTRENPNLIHLKKVQLVKETAVTWEKNLMVEASTAMLQAEKAEWERAQKEKEDQEKEEKDKKKKKSSSSESTKKKKKKRKKKKEKKKKEKEENEGESAPAQHSRLGGRRSAKKDPIAVFGNTGMDPEVRRRRRLGRRVKQSLKKDNKVTSSTESGDSSSDDPSEEDTSTLIEDRSKLHRIHRLAPGLLSSITITNMKEYLNQIGGSGWQQDEGSLPPILGAYIRHYMLGRASGGIAREMVVLGHVGDLLIQSRVSEALDVLIQRLKSLEMSTAGANWMMSQKLELTPQPEPQMGSRSEYQSAKKEAKLDAESRPSGYGYDKPKGQGKDKGGKGKQKDKGKGKDKSKEGDKDKKNAWRRGER